MNHYFKFTIAGVLLSITSITNLALAAQAIHWPNGAKAAISLAYDDALDSQLDNVVPALNKYGFKGSFYVKLASPVINNRFDEWRAIAAQGHELGNHSLYHPCRASLPGREWVTEDADLDRYSVNQMVSEVRLANTFLHAIDGKNDRTFTTPCGDLKAGGEDYVNQIKSEFVGIKSMFGDQPQPATELDVKQTRVWAPTGNSGKELIDFAKRAAEMGTLGSYTFHGVGGDHLMVSVQAHNELLAYLAAHKDIYWVDSFINISRYMAKQQTK